MEDLSRAKLMRTRRSSMTVLYLEWCFSVDSAASLLRNTDAQGPAPPVHDITNGTKEACSTSQTR